MNILFENDSIAVCVKPAGILSQKSDKKNMPEMLEEKLGVAEIYPVHRLDTVTSGVMVYAKTKKAAAFLSKEISENRFGKKYLAIVHGAPEEKEGIMEDLLFKDSRKNKSYVVKRERKGVKKAKLAYSVRETTEREGNVFSLVEIKLFTGRTHQIRVQFASRKMPLYGDGKYGASDNIPFIALHCREISFRNPEDGKEMTFSSEPENFCFFR